MSKKHNHPKLIVNMFGEQLGNLFFNDNGQLSFAYSNEHDSRILSVSMPDRSTIYAGTVVEKWFFGVLPDGESVRRAMAKGKEYEHNSEFGLLADYGADLPGAIQVFSPDTLEQIKSESSYKSVSPEEISERIETMVSESRRHVSMSWHGAHEHWSLAGGQPKFALMKDDDGKYYECLGDAPSNVIVKPGVLDMDEQASIEHLTMSIAKKSGLPVAHSSIVDFAGTSAIVVERYDRETDASGKIARRHQEDFCQALGLLPSQKYMEGKNPTVEAGTMLLKYCGERSLASFVDSILFNR